MRRSDEIQRMKALLHITTSIYTGVRSFRDERPEHFLSAVTVRLESLRASKAALEQFQATGMTSTFMINNLTAAKGHAGRLVEIFSQLSLNKYDRAGPAIQTSLVGMKAICENIAREVRRLGGGLKLHDDPYISLWFPGSPWARLTKLLNERRQLARVRRAGRSPPVR